MMDAQRALLDELMGSARNLTEEEKKGYRELHWDDREVCGCYLVRFCPHDLFVNTKSDLGQCRKVHDSKLKERMERDINYWLAYIGSLAAWILQVFFLSFEKSTRRDLYAPRFEAELAHFCEKLVQDLERKLRRGRERLAQDADISSAMPVPTEKMEQLAAIEEKIKQLLEQIESLGEEGKVDEAEALMRKVDALGAEKTAVVLQANDDKGLVVMAQEKKMALCEICGSFLVANDAAERTQSHVTGKQHVGYGMVRDFIAEYKAQKEKKEVERLAEEKEKEMRKHRERDWEIETGKDDGREKGREERERHGDLERERSREQWQRGRNRDMDRYGLGREGRERDRERYRERGRNSRDRDGDRVREVDHVRKRSRSPYRTGYPARHHVRRY